jgi:NAD(P)-dependent dehydrogenase (short-subunit alcohol dehydrogenase family)
MRGDDLTGKVALVAGAVRKPGIGRATILRLAEMGAAVVCADSVADETDIDPRGDTIKVSANDLRAVVAEVEAAGGRAVAVNLDQSDRESIDNAVRRAVMEFGRLDILCHLGGGTSPERDRPIMELTDGAWDDTVALILTSVFLLNRAAARQMITQGDGGAIVNLGSFAGVRLADGPPAFSALKAGAEAFTKMLARELAPHRIRVNMVHPLGVDAGDGVKNPGLARAAEKAGRSVEQWMRDMIPLGRFQSADETAAVVAFLCSDAASFTSGQAISVAGGATP